MQNRSKQFGLLNALMDNLLLIYIAWNIEESNCKFFFRVLALAFQEGFSGHSGIYYPIYPMLCVAYYCSG